MPLFEPVRSHSHSHSGGLPLSSVGGGLTSCLNKPIGGEAPQVEDDLVFEDTDSLPIGKNLIRTSHAILTPEECRNLINYSESLNYSPASMSGRIDSTKRNNHRVIEIDPIFASALWERIKHLVPGQIEGETFIGKNTWSVVGLDSNFKFYRYGAGEFFQRHYDDWRVLEGGNVTLLTMLIYLNEVKSGGETLFYANEEIETPRFSIKPQEGSMALFSHQQAHAANNVADGEVKYVLRGDVIYHTYPLPAYL